MIGNSPARPLMSVRPASLVWDRESHLRALGDRVFDLLVVGGGATGCSVARDAALRGLDVCLVERSDLAYGSSSRSTRFIHGGLRYLRTLEFAFVREGLQERGILLKVAPHLVRPVQFLFPVYRPGGPPRWMLRLGIAVYDLLAGRHRLPGARGISRSATLNLEPTLRGERLKGSVVYTDAAADDARLVVETAVAAVEAGATIALHVEAERIVPSETGPAVAVLRDRLSGAPLGARAAVVVNAAGPWAGMLLQSSVDGPGPPPAGTRLRLSRGAHLAVARETVPISRVVVMPSRRDGRLLFAVPAGEHTYLGTTEVEHTGPLDEVRAAPEEVEYIREISGEIFDNGPIPSNRILSTWAGVRPLLERPHQPTGKLSRDYRILQEAPGVVTVVGGKLTSCRRMAEAAVDLAASILRQRFGRHADPCITRWKLFPGAEGSLPGPDQGIPPGVDASVTRHLISTYGSRSAFIFRKMEQHPPSGIPFVPGCPATPAEVMLAVEREGAVRLSDLLFRRFHPMFMEARLASPAGREVADCASRLMASWLGWDEGRRARELAEAIENWRRQYAVPSMAAGRIRSDG